MRAEVVTTSDGSLTLYSERFQQTYHSTHGALTESRIVFIEGSGLKERLEQAAANQQTVQLLEIGFGLGLNFLLSADLAYTSNSKLAYHAIENDPVPVSLLEQLNYQHWLSEPSLATRLHEGLHKTSLTENDLLPGLSLQLQDSLDKLEQTTKSNNPQFDIVYLDAFSPDTNPDCWTEPVINQLHNLMAPEGVLVTYSAKGAVRRSLEAAGFETKRLPGPPGKREFLRAVRSVG